MFAELTLEQQHELSRYLTQFVTDHKQDLIKSVMAQRTRHLTVVLENIFQPHNASAVLRSCDCFGVQDVHIVEDENEYRVNPDIALGASKWLTLHRYGHDAGHNMRRCVGRLRDEGYRIVATTLREDSIPLPELAIDHKTALCFGTEEFGLSEEAHELADAYVQIPMFGFTQSFNISVSAALCLYELTNRLHQLDLDWTLSAAEKTQLRTLWLMRATTNGRALVRHFYRQNQIEIPEYLLEPVEEEEEED